MPTRLLLGLAARGAAAGLAVDLAAYLVYLLAYEYARADTNDFINSADPVGDMVMVAMLVGLPLLYFTSVFAVWLVRLWAPWHHSLAALIVGGGLACPAARLGIWWAAAVMVLVYAATGFAFRVNRVGPVSTV
ncbi:hypothetical protein [Hamadaea tsunoensis]|uniref:hypothetical protein n=1 Tax=Hamadaea tsunoensis TaxID=53368 RepID=UPI0004087FFA|nr:hypothetical protein [Hamadaea tsunoensis]